MNTNVWLGVAAAALASGCSKPETKYEDPNRMITLQNKLSMNDLSTFAGECVQQLISRGTLEGKELPMVFLAGIQNDTAEHIDTQTIADIIQNKLLNSGKFRFKAGGQGQQYITDEINWQSTSALPSEAVKAGKQKGAKFIMYGRLAGDVQKNGDTVARDYLFTLRAADIETGEVLVNNQKEIRKVTSNASVGW
jgi:uncharacterized protein (TIGR02722 family)